MLSSMVNKKLKKGYPMATVLLYTMMTPFALIMMVGVSAVLGSYGPAAFGMCITACAFCKYVL